MKQELEYAGLKCRKCSLIFDNVSNLNRHMKGAHYEGLFRDRRQLPDLIAYRPREDFIWVEWQGWSWKVFVKDL